MTENKYMVSWEDHKGNLQRREVEAMTEHEAMNRIRTEDLSYKNISTRLIAPERTNIKELFP